LYRWTSRVVVRGTVFPDWLMKLAIRGPEASRRPDVPSPGPRPVPMSEVRPAGDGGPAGGEPDDGLKPGAGGPPKAA